MCGVIGVQLQQVTADQLLLVRNLFVESEIRGMHATGVTYEQYGRLVTIKEPVKGSKFIQMHDPSNWLDRGDLKFIAHVRYSTSDLNYNQPIADDEFSIVHNGVISQEPPESWSDVYGFDFETKNDSEILFHYLKRELTIKTVMSSLKDASISFCSLRLGEPINYARNGRRPLHAKGQPNGFVLASTKDILIRSGFDSSIMKLPPKFGLDLQP